MGGAGMFAVSLYMMLMGGFYDRLIAKKLPEGADLKMYNAPEATAEMKAALGEANKAANRGIVPDHFSGDSIENADRQKRQTDDEQTRDRTAIEGNPHRRRA